MKFSRLERSDGWVSFRLWTDAGYLVGLEGSTVRDAWPNEDDIEDVGPCEIRKDKPIQSKAQPLRSSDNHLMPDCENTFEIWRRNTSYKTLLVRALLVLFILTIAALMVLTFIGPVV